MVQGENVLATVKQGTVELVAKPDDQIGIPVIIEENVENVAEKMKRMQEMMKI